MTKQQLINELKAIGSEYMYQDVGYGGFYCLDNTFMAMGIVYEPTKAELKEMLDTYYAEEMPDAQEMKELLELLKKGN